MICVFWPPIAKHNSLVGIQDIEENEWERIGNDGLILEMDEGDGLAWPWSYWSIWEKEDKAQV